MWNPLCPLFAFGCREREQSIPHFLSQCFFMGLAAAYPSILPRLLLHPIAFGFTPQISFFSVILSPSAWPKSTRPAKWVSTFCLSFQNAPNGQLSLQGFPDGQGYLARTRTVPDLTLHVRGSDRYKPQWYRNDQVLMNVPSFLITNNFCRIPTVATNTSTFRPSTTKICIRIGTRPAPIWHPSNMTPTGPITRVPGELTRGHDELNGTFLSGLTTWNGSTTNAGEFLYH